MNSLLCRAKRLDNGEWVEGYVVPVGRDINNGEIYEWAIRQKEKRGECFCLETYLIDPATLCRCTGLEDKNGKLIFERNILHDPDWETDFIVIWKNLSWEIFTAFDTDTDPLDELFDSNNKTDAFIIGNTIDNPELLEV